MHFGRVGMLKVLFGEFSFRYISLCQLRMCCQFFPFPNGIYQILLICVLIYLAFIDTYV